MLIQNDYRCVECGHTFTRASTALIYRSFCEHTGMVTLAERITPWPDTLLWEGDNA